MASSVCPRSEYGRGPGRFSVIIHDMAMSAGETEALHARINHALDLIDQDRFAEAEAVCRQLQQRHPRDPHVNRVLANALMLQRNFPQAMYFLDRCVQLAPADDAYYLFIIARLRRQISVDKVCADLFTKSVAIDASNVDAWLGLTDSLLAMGQSRDAMDACEKALSLHPMHPDLCYNACVAMQSLGRAEESYRQADELVRQDPSYPPGRLIRAGTAMHAGGVSPEQIRDDAREYWVLRGGRRGIGPALDPGVKAAAVEAARSGVLKLGLISPDFREHSVAYFIEPLLRGLDPSRVQVTCYSTSPYADHVTERLVKLATQWRTLALASIGVIADAVRRDGVHIALDLAGHTSGSGLPALGFEPAPVLGTFCGYPGTSGLETVDVRIVDALTDPAGSPYDAQGHSVERLVRIDPCFLCYRPDADAPAVCGGPASRNEPPTFGSYNALKKVSNAALDAWARVLQSVEGSRFVLKTRALDDARSQGDLLNRFAARGIDRSRISIIESTKTSREHLQTYDRMDIALDTFPYNGTTTTCEALHMGVPVVCVAGAMHASRVGLSLLNAAGLPELCAADIDGYVRIAGELASDPTRLSELRRTLRGRLAKSVLCDERAYAERFERAVRAAVIETAERV